MSKKTSAAVAEQTGSSPDAVGLRSAHQLAEDAAHDAACRDMDIIRAAGITNGMPADEQRRRLLLAAGFIVSE